MRSTIKQAISKLTGDAKTEAADTPGRAANEAESTRKRTQRATRDATKE